MAIKTFAKNLSLYGSGTEYRHMGTVVQDDVESNVFELTILDREGAADLTEVDHVTFSVLKPDQSRYVDSLGERITIDTELSKVSITLGSSALDTFGEYLCTVELYTGEKRITSARICYTVSESILEGADIEGDVHYPVLTNLIKQIQSDSSGMIGHISDKENPHEVTAEQLGLENVDNTSDLDKPISNATQEALDGLNASKVEKVEGKGLSTNDFTAELKENYDSAVSVKHSHDNKALLDSYTQTDSDIASAVSNKHSHSNKELLDSYTNSNSDISSAVANSHSHSNKSLLDTYTQTESNLASAVELKHTHENKTVLDSISSALLSTLNTVATMFSGISNIVTILGSDDTTIPTSKAVADAISFAGGGDMLKSSYDTTNTGNKVDTSINSEKLGGNLPSYYAADSDLDNHTGDSTIHVTSAEKTTWDGKYAKASGGIPKTDLEPSVQASLDKADTAIQDISGKEDKSSKSNILTYSYTQYPTCNAVKTALDGKATTVTYDATIWSGDWFGYESDIFFNTIDVDGISSSDNPIVDIVIEDFYDVETMEALNDAWSKVLAIQTFDGAIEVYATEELGIDIPIQLKVVR